MCEKAIIFGCGNKGKKALELLESKFDIEIIAFADNKYDSNHKFYHRVPIIKPEQILEFEFNKIFISVVDIKMINDIVNQLHNLGIKDKQIEILATSHKYMNCYMDQRMNWIMEYARYINTKGIDGSVAECGVFRGDSAKFINKFFKNRKFYLFDTFEGFSKIDLNYELSLNNDEFNNSIFADNPFKEVKEVLINLVISKMIYPENCIIKDGIFPESAKGIDDKFIFVNLDMDLYKPMLEGLHFFWNKIQIGGVILLHDYFLSDLPGVSMAVRDFERNWIQSA